MVRFQSIEQSLGKIKDVAFWLDRKAIYMGSIVLFAASGAFLAGFMLSGQTNTYPVVLEACSMVFQSTTTPAATTNTQIQTHNNTGPYVGSRSSNKFHHESCPGARLIKEVNKVYFSSKEDARAKGYVPAGNCDI